MFKGKNGQLGLMLLLGNAAHQSDMLYYILLTKDIMTSITFTVTMTNDITMPITKVDYDDDYNDQMLTNDITMSKTLTVMMTNDITMTITI